MPMSASAPVLLESPRNRMQCDRCGAKSGVVDNVAFPTAYERQMIAEFMALHDLCEPGAATRETPVQNGGPFGSPKADPVHVRKAHGHAEYTGPYGEIQEVETIQCPHCQRHVEMRKGVPQKLGWCSRCARQTCGHPRCEECVPSDLRLTNVEHGLGELTPKPQQVIVPEFTEFIDGQSCEVLREVRGEAGGSGCEAPGARESAPEPVQSIESGMDA